MFVLIRHPDELSRVCNDVSQFLAFRNQKTSDQLPDALLGAWFDPHMISDTPDALATPDELRQIKIRETFGISGVWTLCWLEKRLTRRALLEALIVASGQHTPGQTGFFAPVFPTTASEADVKVEVKQLSTLHPDNVHPPLYQNPDTGMLVPPTASNGVALYPDY